MNSTESALAFLKVATALAPLGIAVVVRVVAGRKAVAQLLMLLGVTWFTVNVLLAPFTDFGRLAAWLR